MSAQPGRVDREIVHGTADCPSCGQPAEVTVDSGYFKLVCDHCLYELWGSTIVARDGVGT